ncbi:hypothetical protein [Tunicatimonas pelagia]|uniref:hypothetical protein n=1 Tax=Tunicatimonas pelagia TaxID=931531 RepID=UPI00266666E6|nr:hypothetical protein [Tunicatimonas pelagia]WKN45201.1 hypothetical protein P0M28_09540 [Tunicatimonas pelagia]
MKRIYIASLLVTMVAFAGCRDEDVIRQPDWITPVIPLAPDFQPDDNPIEDAFNVNDLTNSSVAFTLGIEDFDGAEDGHRFFVGREGPTSELIDFTFLMEFYDSEADTTYGPVEYAIYQPTDFPVNVNITPAEAAGFFSEATVEALEEGDQFVLSYEYRINANQSGETRTLGTPSADYCGGFSDQGEFCELTIDVVDSRPEATYFTLVPDSDGDIILGNDTLARASFSPLSAGSSQVVYATFDTPLQSAPTFAATTADGGAISGVEAVMFTEDDDEVQAYRATFTAGTLAAGDVDILATGATETSERGGETMADDDFSIQVDNTSPTYLLSYSAPATNTGFDVTITAEFDETVQENPTISISGQGITPVESVEMELVGDQVAVYTFSPEGETLTEGPLNIVVTAKDVPGNDAVADADTPMLEIVQ